MNLHFVKHTRERKKTKATLVQNKSNFTCDQTGKKREKIVKICSPVTNETWDGITENFFLCRILEGKFVNVFFKNMTLGRR